MQILLLLPTKVPPPTLGRCSRFSIFASFCYFLSIFCFVIGKVAVSWLKILAANPKPKPNPNPTILSHKTAT